MSARPKRDSTDQNLTLRIPQEAVRLAKIEAASRGTSVSRLFTDLIYGIAREKGEYEKAKKRAIARLRKGYDFGGPTPKVSRDELYDR